MAPRENAEGPEHARVPALLIFLVFLKLGLTSFGGPIAHLAYFQTEFVQRRRWLSASAYAELVALCQFLPGPASSQTGFAIGLKLAGGAGAAAAFIGFTLPSAALMLAAAFWLTRLPPDTLTPVVHGLKLVAVSVVAHAVATMALAHCRKPAMAVLAIITLAGLLIVQHPAATPAIILFAALAGALVGRAPPLPTGVIDGQRRTVQVILAFGLFAGLLAGLPLLRLVSDGPLIATLDSFYRAGALVFGGGHVILPLLQVETAGIVPEDVFLAGYGAAQALPGPLSAFAAYLGALNGGDAPSLTLGLVALAAIFLPCFLLVLGAVPLWNRLLGAQKSGQRAARAVAWANAAVVGVLAAALVNPVASSALFRLEDIVVALIGFALLMLRTAPVLAIVAAVAVSGALIHAFA